MKRSILFLFTFLLFFSISEVTAQGVTSGSISGLVTDKDGYTVPEANVVAKHIPTGTNYGTITNEAGEFRLPSVKVGGPYIVTVTYIGFYDNITENINVSLGETFNLEIILFEKSSELEEVVVVVDRNTIISSSASGATSKFDARKINVLPNLDRSTESFVRLTPQAGTNGFLGQSNKQNFITIDGASFNNAFGLGGPNLLPGGNTNAQPISIEAIEQVQVSLSPFDIRQAGFTGAGINTVTKSGTNEFQGSIYSFLRNGALIGTKVADEKIERTDLFNSVTGFTLGGPIIKNKLFFFTNYESARNTAPAFNTVAGRQGLSGDNVSDVQANTLNELSDYLNTTYGYKTGRFEGYNRNTNSDKFLIKLDWNINKNNKAVLRYSQLNSSMSPLDVNLTNTSTTYENFGWKRSLETYSIVAELNSTISDNISNRFFASYNSIPEFRAPLGGQRAPFTIINDNGLQYTFGTHPAAVGNRIEQKFLQLQNDLTWFINNHKITSGISYELMDFSNEFTLFNTGFYIFNSLSSFYNNSPAGTTTPIGISSGEGHPALFQYRFPLDRQRITTKTNPKFSQLGFYFQDEIPLNDNFRLTGGVRFDVTSFINNPDENIAVTSLTFQGQDGSPEKYNTSILPRAKVLISPRVGFNYRTPNRKVQLRGGTGIFTGRIPFTLLEKQFSRNGISEGEILQTNFDGSNTEIQNFPWTTDIPETYRPNSSNPVSTYDLALVNPDFTMPQVWRSDLGVDIKLPANIIGTVEFIYGKDINAAYIRNVNLDRLNGGIGPNGQFVFSDNRLHDNITGAYVIDNTNKGHAFSITTKLEKEFSKNWSASLAYSFNKAKNVSDLNESLPDRIYNQNPIVGNGNLEILSTSLYGPRHNFVGSAAYLKEWTAWTSSTFSFFFRGAQEARFSYIYSNNDVNGDGSNTNDLIYVPSTSDEINLVQNGSFTPDQQWQALNGFIERSDYLRSRRGRFAERNGLNAPLFFQLDFKLLQDINIYFKDKKHSLQFSWDVFNLTNLINRKWGIVQTPRTTTPIQAVSSTEFTVNPNILNQSEFVNNTGELSRWRMQFGLKYSF